MSVENNENIVNNENIDNSNNIIIINKNINNFLDNHTNIKKYLSNNNNNDEVCIICLEPYNSEKDNQILKYNHCGRLYIHEICFYNWFNVKDECLLCKKQLINREESIETQSEEQIVPRFNNMFIAPHNIHRFFINNNYNNYRNYNNQLINYYNNNSEIIRDIDDINDTNNMRNNQLIFIQNELIFHINNNVSRRNFSIFLICFKLLYFIPPIIILCAIYELNNYFD